MYKCDSAIRIVDLLLESRQTPGIRILVLVVQRIDLLVLLVVRQLGVVSHFEEGRRVLDQPFRLNESDLNTRINQFNDQ